MEKQKKSLFGPMDLTKGTCWKTILIFSLPVILSYLLQQVYSISDAAIVGQTLTAQEVAGVNDTTSLVFIFSKSPVQATIPSPNKAATEYFKIFFIVLEIFRS